MLRLTHFFVAFILAAAVCANAVAQGPGVPAKGYDVHYYKATVRLYPAQDSLSGEVDMTATATGDLTQILQHAKFLTIDSVFVDNIRSSFTLSDSLSGAYNVSGFPLNYHNGSAFTLKTFYHGKGMPEAGGGNWGGVHNTGGMMFAMGVGFTAPYISCTRQWMPCYDEPDDKADSVTLDFYADTSGIVVSNGLLAASGIFNDNYTTFCEWKVSHPIASYLLTFAFGPFKHLAIANPLHIPFDVYAFAKDTARLRALMEKRVVEGLVFFDSLFAPYPFEKVGYVIAPIGSMEHQTMITLVNSVFDTNNTTAVHELSHQWWGDRVTCYDFNDPWLNEGFAAYCESLFQERFSGIAQYWKNQHAHIASSFSPVFPLYGAPSYTKPRNNYPPLIYDKGAAVLGMLRYFLGDSVFFSAIRAYGNAHAYSTATSADLENTFESIAKEDLRWFFNKWVFGSGNPLLNVLWSRNGNTANLRIEQMQDSMKLGFFRLPLVIEARSNDGKTERHEILLDSVHISQITFSNSFIPDSLIIDPDGAVIKRINGTVKLGINRDNPGELSLPEPQFNPNPSNAKKIFMTVSTRGGRRVRGGELMIFDSNGNNVLTLRLDNPKESDPHSPDTEVYSCDIHSLASGTYFATLLLNGATIGGRGNFVVTR